MQATPRHNPLDRLLRLFSDVRPGEGATALLLALNIFLVLTAYYFIKPVREALILVSGGAEIKSYSSAGQALLLLGAVPLYGLLANRMPRRRLINIVTVFFGICLGLFFLISRVSPSSLSLAIVFYLWIGIFNLMVVAQFWSFANDIYTTAEGERLFPIVAFGASAGAVVGSFVSGGIIELVGVHPPLILAAIILLLSLIVTNYVDASERRQKEADLPSVLTTGSMPAASGEFRLEDIRNALAADAGDPENTEGGSVAIVAEPQPQETKSKSVEEISGEIMLAGGQNPFMMVIKCRYLVFIGLLLLLLNWVNTTGEYILGSVVEDAAAEAVATGQAGGLTQGAYIGAFYANFFGVVNLLGLFIQMFLVSRAIKYLGVRLAILILPLISLSAYLLLAFYPLLAFVRWSKTFENATDYSLQNTVRHVLFLPGTREQKYKAKQAIDSFFVRAGDVLSAVVVFVGTTYLAMGPGSFAAFNIALVVIWLGLSLLIGRDYKSLVDSGRPPCV